MSWKALSWAEDQTTGSAGAKLVLLVLAGYADKLGFSYPSQKSISEISEQGVRTVRRHLEHLESIGLLSRKERQRKTGGRTSDGYQLNTPQAPGQNGHTDAANMAGAPGQDGGEPPAKMTGAIEPSEEPTTEPSIEETFHKVWCEVTGHSRAQLSPTRLKRYRDVIKDMKRFHLLTATEFIQLWGIMVRAFWSEPWRRKQLTGHDSVNILAKPEQREAWIEVAITELNAGRDGTGYHERINGEPTKESADDSRKRSAILERSQVADEEREAAEDAKAQEEIAKATRWFRALTEAAQKEVDAEVTKRLARDFPGVPESKILRKSIFLTIHKERSAA